MFIGGACCWWLFNAVLFGVGVLITWYLRVNSVGHLVLCILLV